MRSRRASGRGGDATGRAGGAAGPGAPTARIASPAGRRAAAPTIAPDRARAGRCRDPAPRPAPIDPAPRAGRGPCAAVGEVLRADLRSPDGARAGCGASGPGRRCRPGRHDGSGAAPARARTRQATDLVVVARRCPGRPEAGRGTRRPYGLAGSAAGTAHVDPGVSHRRVEITTPENTPANTHSPASRCPGTTDPFRSSTWYPAVLSISVGRRRGVGGTGPVPPSGNAVAALLRSRS